MPVRSDEVRARLVYPSGVVSKEVFLEHLPILSKNKSIEYKIRPLLKHQKYRSASRKIAERQQ
jgi:hypothetical protein